MVTKYHHNPDTASPYQAVFLNNGQTYVHTPVRWQALQNEPADLVDIVIAFHTWIFGLDAKGFVWKWDNNKWEKDPDAKNVVDLTSDHVGLWAVNKDGQVYVKTNLAINAKWSKADEHIPQQAGDVSPSWEYIVKPGDYLWKIVRNEYKTWGNDLATASIVAQVKLLNKNIANWDLLQIGIKLNMPPKTS
jgi:hypothetical protein